MTAATLNRTFFMSDGFGIEPKVYSGSKGAKVFSGVAVFRSGTFRDSMGYQNTWEDLHIKQMMDNYEFLHRKGIVESVPARDGHQAWLVGNIPGRGEVVGWHTDLKTKTMKSPIDGTEYEYLLADYEITQDYALEKIQNGTWRNRSAEIGGYSTNNETELWPVYLGFAFVDFSAVEGLNFSMSQGNRFFAYLGSDANKEIHMTEGQSGVPALPVPPMNQHTVPGTGQAQPVAQAPAAAPFVFSIGGQNVTDPNAVQAHVNRLEGFAKEQREAGRKAFVGALVAANKLTVAQKDGQEAFALSLTDEQFEAWKTGWELAPASSVLGNHTSGVTNPDNTAQHGAAFTDLDNAEEIVKMHERAGMAADKVKQTASYAKLVAAGKRPA